MRRPASGARWDGGVGCMRASVRCLALRASRRPHPTREGCATQVASGPRPRATQERITREVTVEDAWAVGQRPDGDGAVDLPELVSARHQRRFILVDPAGTAAQWPDPAGEPDGWGGVGEVQTSDGGDLQPAELHAVVAAVAGVVQDRDVAPGQSGELVVEAGWLAFTSSR